MDNLIRLTLTPTEGLMIGTLLDAVIEQHASASIEERNDPGIARMYDICTRIRPFLPKVKE